METSCASALSQTSNLWQARNTMKQEKRNPFDSTNLNKDVAHDCLVLAYMIELYCHDHHPTRPKESLKTPAAKAGIYEKAHHSIKLCDECAAHLAYGELRRVHCPQDPKPNCKDCSIHCYKKEEAQFQKEAMAYAGKRALLHPYLLKDALLHLWQGLKHRIKAAKSNNK